MDEIYCPGCGSGVGDSSSAPPVQCWKCGLQFGRSASNKPVYRPSLIDSRVELLRFVGGLFAPTLLYWLVAEFGEKLPSSPLITTFAIVPMAGLVLFGVACFVYVLGKLASAERGFWWLATACLLVGLMFYNAILLMRALSTF